MFGGCHISLKYIWFSFDGRINRQIYWIQGFLAFIAAEIIIAIVFGGLAALISPEIFMVAFIFYFALLWPGLAIGVKRCHDRDKSGWFLLISLIPLIGPIWLLVELGFLSGTEGENRFGPDPLGGSAPAEADG